MSGSSAPLGIARHAGAGRGPDSPEPGEDLTLAPEQPCRLRGGLLDIGDGAGEPVCGPSLNRDNPTTDRGTGAGEQDSGRTGQPLRLIPGSGMADPASCQGTEQHDPDDDHGRDPLSFAQRIGACDLHRYGSALVVDHL
mgnify:CR=1 FL=1